MESLIYGFVFLFGLLAGSFLNSVIYRLHTKEDIVKKRSHCPKCGKILAWYELIPVFSFLAQRGRCRRCGKKISFQYPLVEVVTAAIFVAIINNQETITKQLSILNYQTVITTLFLWLVASALIVIFVYDLKHYIIPDKILIPLIVLTAFYQLFVWLLKNWDLFGNWKLEIGNSVPLTYYIVAAVGTSLFFYLIYALSRGTAMGFGDVKFAFFMGLLLGWPYILAALFLAFNLGALIGIILIFAGKKSLKNQIPFAPFLILGTMTTLFWGKEIINWYFSLFF